MYFTKSILAVIRPANITQTEHNKKFDVFKNKIFHFNFLNIDLS